jgi:hypothetical protein
LASLDGGFRVDEGPEDRFGFNTSVTAKRVEGLMVRAEQVSPDKSGSFTM